MKFGLMVLMLISLQFHSLLAQKIKKERSFTAKVLYLNGETIRGKLVSVSDKSIELKIEKEVRVTGGKMQYISFQKIEASKIKKLTLKNRKVVRAGFITGFFLGGFIGFVIGNEKQKRMDEANLNNQNTGCICPDLGGDSNPIAAGMIGGMVLGSVTGALVGQGFGTKVFRINGNEATLFQVKDFFYRTKKN
jgi:outer membrane lipoprotein SlyB